MTNIRQLHPLLLGKPDMFGGGNIRAGTSPSKSFYMSAGDFYFSDKIKYNATTNVVREISADQSCVQPIILNEFQPDTVIYDSKLIFAGADTALTFAQSVPGVKQIIEFVNTAAGTPVVKAGAENLRTTNGKSYTC